jgi:hypothetical protein
MLKLGEINPLNVFNLRKLEHCPPHFAKVIFDAKATNKLFTDWIYENLAGRFWFGDVYLRSDSRITIQKCAAFEISSEASYFALILDQLNQHNF